VLRIGLDFTMVQLIIGMNKMVEQLIKADRYETIAILSLIIGGTGFIVFIGIALGELKYLLILAVNVPVVIYNIHEYKKRTQILREFDEKERATREKTNLDT
jgi:mannose/fructose-specific phosphotransferase system component IIA